MSFQNPNRQTRAGKRNADKKKPCLNPTMSTSAQILTSAGNLSLLCVKLWRADSSSRADGLGCKLFSIILSFDRGTDVQDTFPYNVTALGNELFASSTGAV
jgi:hypothetical protein